MRLPLTAAALFLCGGCAGRMLRLENRVLTSENADLRRQVADLETRSLPKDYARKVTFDTVRDFATRAGFSDPDDRAPNVLLFPIQGTHAPFRLMIQFFDQEDVLYLAITDYLTLEQAPDPAATMLLLSTLATENYDLLLGKFQLNPATGAVTLSVELNLDDGLGFQTFNVVAHHLVNTADDRYPTLNAAAGGTGL